MTSFTVNLDESSKAGKAFLAMAETFFKDVKGLEIIKNPVASDKATAKEKEHPTTNNIPNAETVKAINDIKNGVGLTKTKNSKDLFKSLGI